MSLPEFPFFFDAKYLGRAYQLQLKPLKYCLSTTVRYRALVDWSLDVPILEYYEKTESIKYSNYFGYPRPIFHYVNLTCWDLIKLLENTVDNHDDFEEYCCCFIDGTEDSEEETPK